MPKEEHKMEQFHMDPSAEETDKQSFNDRDQLARLGKKAVLRRNFGFMSILGFSCTVLITWEASLSLFAQAYANGGPAGAVYGFLFVWFGNICVFSCLSELASMAPTSGGQYHWVAMLAPRSCSKFLSYITGWLAVAGWQGSLASALYLAGSIMAALIGLTNPDTYQPQPYQPMLLFWASVVFCVVINAWVSSLLAKFEGFILILHIVGFFGILIPVVYLSPTKNSAEQVFTTFVSLTGWPDEGSNQGVAFFIGLMGNVFAFVGVDGAFHMAEEVHNPSVVVPQSTILSLLINGTLGFAMILAALFCMGDPKVTLDPNGFPFMQIFLHATGGDTGGSVVPATVMSSVILVLGLCGTVGLFASTSRVFWSFARDRGLPFWRTLSEVNSATSIPLWSIGCTAIISILISLITLGSTTAFTALISLSVSGLYSSYLICTILLLYRRVTKGFKLPDPSVLPALAPTEGLELVWGPWHIPGIWGTINNVVAICYLLIVWVFSFFPSQLPVTPQNMNYSSLMTGSVTIFAIVYYLVWAKREYRGPIVEL